jgi:hypothetical protein
MFELATALVALFNAGIVLAHAAEAYQAPNSDIDQPAFRHAAMSVEMPAAPAKRQCSLAGMSQAHSQQWSYRLVHGRKCWYEGRPGLSKSLLEWPKEISQQSASSTEVSGALSEKAENPIAGAPKGKRPKEKSEQPGSGREVTGAITEESGDAVALAARASDSLSRFGDWTITKNDAVISLRSDTGKLAVSCSDATLTYLAFIKISGPRPIAGPPEIKPPPAYFKFTAWADSNEPADFTFLVGHSSDEYATGIVLLNPEFADQNTKFWNLLKSAKSSFSYSTSAGTISMNALDLSAAIARFQEECFKIFKANAHHHLREPIHVDWLRN